MDLIKLIKEKIGRFSSTLHFSGLESVILHNYVMSFDFDAEILEQLKGKIPDEAMDILMKREKGHRHCVQFPDGVYHVDVVKGSPIKELVTH
jgi:hypothetical protein